MRSRSTTPPLDNGQFSESAAWFQDVIGYADSVVNGKKPACKDEIAACKNFLNDYQASKTDEEYPYRLDFKRAYRVIGFIELLPHVKGHYASQIGKNRLIQLAPWQKFVICNIFGWINKATELRRYTEVYIKVPRKNGKSTLCAGIGLYMLCADGEPGAEVLCGATKYEQAKKVYEPALQMIRQTPALKHAYGLIDKERFIKRKDGSVMEPLVGDPGDGGNPSCAINDEYHEADTDTLYQTMKTGMGSRQQPLMVTITTAGKNLFSPCYDLEKTARGTLSGLYNLPHLFAVIYGVDEDDDWTDPQMLIKANPNYGISVGADFVKQALKTALQRVSEQVDYKTKHLNIWCNQKEAYYNLEKWQTLHAQSMQKTDFTGESCYIGLDLAKVRDLSAKVIVFRKWHSVGDDIYGLRVDGKQVLPGWHYYVFTRFYICDAQIDENDNKMLQMMFGQWRDAGHLHVCDGNQIDFHLITDEILIDAEQFSVEEIPHDPHGASQIATDLQNAGLVPVKITQHGALLTAPITELYAAIETGRIHHDGNPVMAWCIGNVAIKEYQGGNKMPTKQNDESKIDGAAALLTAFARCVVPEEGALVIGDDYELVGA